ncbi:MAG TPA: GAF domain-containing protein [Syntrophales bacterium]|nr:GAF domain-containing protein [Syntrophales bacterium]HON22218.1 GAF domain-containing protein [Syntrophales bacterium]HQG33715.1 GAF domain-containing protein [Syntrophales bacterium]HRU88248.1 GAF domain-containing protein [Syntrophales bacterium]
MKQDSAINKEIRLHQAELLLNVARTMASYETLDEMLSVLVEITTREIRADRGTIFLNDPETGELYSRVAQGNFQREIRIINNTGIAGHVFTTGESLIVYDAYADSRFNRSVDEKTGYVTKSILCVPIRTMKGEVIGAAQMLNKKRGRFSREDMQLLESMTTQAAITLQSIGVVEKMQKFRAKEMEFFDLVSNVTAEIDLGSLLQKVMSEATRMLNAERSTLFLNDEKHKELFSKVWEGLGAMEIRLPNHLGIAGAVFQSGETINIPYAYADLRFNPAFDRKTGFFTRSILCVPVINKAGKLIGVTQVLNKRGGTFTREDESRLRAFTAQVSIALENAKLFDDIQNMKNYSESMLESMSNGVITLNEEGRIVTCNAAGLRIMQVEAEAILERPVAEFFTGHNAWVVEKINRVVDTRKPELAMDAELAFEANKVAANITIMPLTSVEKKKLGVMIIIDDISSEKRVKSTMSRYMDPGLADQLLEGGEDILGGKSTMATILFSDIRQFTTLTEELGAQGTVSLLNEYFTIMVECIQKEGGMLDKFIGDAIMAAFGIPMAHDDDEDRAVRAAIAMINALENWNRERVSQGKRPVKMGLGLNTDVIVSGNIGSPKRMDYTLIGDGVNLASRLESLCKRYHAQILISENTYKRLRGTYRIRQVDSVVVKGKTEPVGVFEVLDYHSAESFPNLMESVNHFQEGLQSYRRQQWEGAITSFRKALGKNPADEICRMYIDRCELLKKNPPQEGWDGVWIMDSK